MTFSLIVATLGRVQELDRLFDSLEAQEGVEFEVIVVDQNLDDRLKKLLENRPKLNIKHLTSERGLSRARNVGLKAATGDVACYPDDDCWYPADYLAAVETAMNQHTSQGLATIVRDENGAPFARWDEEEGLVTKFNLFRRTTSIGIFTRTEIAREVGGFNEKLGVGAGTQFGGGEELDFLLKVIEKGHQIYYDPKLFVCHPAETWREDESEIPRAYSYNMGSGVVLRTHHYSPTYFAKGLFRSYCVLAYYALRFQKHRFRFQKASISGKINGWRAGATGI